MEKTILKIKTLFEKEGFYVDTEKVQINDQEQDKLSVLIELEGKEPENGLLLEMLLIPQIEQEIEGCHILQFFIEFNYDLEEIGEEMRLALIDTLTDFNYNLPVGAFGVLPANNMLFYKHMVILPEELTAEVESTLAQTIWLISYLQNQCYPSIEGILEAE